jgi:hypothetical protein
MNSEDSKPKAISVISELFEEKIGSNSFNTYVTTNNSWAHHSNNSNSESNVSEKSYSAKSPTTQQMAFLINLLKSDSKETIIQIEAKANFII